MLGFHHNSRSTIFLEKSVKPKRCKNLENRLGATPRGFESLCLRQNKKHHLAWCFCFRGAARSREIPLQIRLRICEMHCVREIRSACEMRCGALGDLFHFTLRPTGAIFHNFRKEIISHSAQAEYFTCNLPDFMLY